MEPVWVEASSDMVSSGSIMPLPRAPRNTSTWSLVIQKQKMLDGIYASAESGSAVDTG